MLKRFFPLVLGLLVLAGCSENPLQPALRGDDVPDALLTMHSADLESGKAVIANRGSGTISVIDARTLDVTDYALPMAEGESTPEPMYIVHVKRHQRVFVGDRANNRVVAFDDRSFDVVGNAPAGAGVFHMWADAGGRQLWVNNDIDNTSTVIDPGSLSVLATVDIPADLVAMGGKPHDIILDARGRFAYVTLVGIAGAHDYLLQFDTGSWAEVARAQVGKDPHLSLARQHDKLYVPCQNTDQVYIFDRKNLGLITVLDVPGAHGAAMSRDGRYFYVSNLPGGGEGAITTIRTRDDRIIGEPVDSPHPVPHNLALAPNGRQLFVTHSGGAAEQVSVYRISGHDPAPIFVETVTVGLNPFGLAYVH